MPFYCTSISNYIYVLHQFPVLTDSGPPPNQLQPEILRGENHQHSKRKRVCSWSGIASVVSERIKEIYHSIPNEAIPESDSESLVINIDSDEHNSISDNIPGEVEILTTFR